MLKRQEKQRVILGVINVHYMGPDDPDYAPYYLHSGNECKKVGESGLYHEEHEVIFYNQYVILTVYEARFHLFGISDGWVLSGPYTVNLKFRKEHSYWQIKKESFDLFHESIKNV